MLKKLWRWIIGTRPIAGFRQPPLEIGSRWVMPRAHEGNPWRDDSVYAVIADVKEGWVRLALGDGGHYELPIKRFRDWFKRAPNTHP